MANHDAPTIGPDDAAALLRMQATLFMILEQSATSPEPEEPKPEPKAERRKPLALKPEAE